MLLGVALMLTQCVCGSNKRPTEVDAGPERPAPAVEPEAPTPAAPGANEPAPAADPKPELKLPAALDTKDLDHDEKLLLQEVLEEQYDPCGKPRSFLEGLGASDACPEAHKLAGLAVARIADGLSKRQVVQELLKEQARWAAKADFDLEGSPSFGEPGAGKKVIVEFFDYQCPHCKLTHKPAKEIVQKAGAVLYYKMLPLEMHPFAREAALHALAAHRQGRFSELHERLFDNQDRLSSAVIRELAQQAGLDMTRLDRDLADPTLTQQLERDIAESTRAKVGGTPTFFVDGYETELDQLEAALK